VPVPSISASQVTKLYDAEVGVQDLTMQIREHSLLGLIGPSGCGKTTTVRLFTGLLPRDSGDLEVLGRDPDRFHGDIRSKIGYLPQGSVLYPTLSLRENLEFVGALYGMGRGQRRAKATELLERVELIDAEDRRLEQASGGMTRRLGLAAALMHDPELLFLDEPTAGLDPILRRSVWKWLESLRDEGRTLIVTTQHVSEAAYCDAIVLLDRGRIVEQGAPEALRARAFNGELVDVTFQDRPSWSVVEAIQQGIAASEVRPIGPRSVRLTVEDAGSAIPRIAELAGEHGAAVSEVERFLPEFDDVFVRLVHRNNARVPA
jgi:ABC-2 type transport system ATP-binding protein